MYIKNQSSDYLFITYLGAFILFGLLVLSSAGVAEGMSKFGDAYFFIKRQLLFGFLPGLILFFVCAKIDFHVWKKYSLFIFIVGIFLLILTFVPGIGSKNGTGSQSWINVFGHSFQPAEAMKLSLIIFLSAFLSTLGKRIEEFGSGFIVALCVGLIPVTLIVLQPDVGTAFILASIIFLLLVCAKSRWSHIVILLLVGVIGFWAMIMSAPYRAQRLTTFLHPELDPQGQGYQINQAFLAIGSGGLFGLGLGHSRQKFQYLPEVHADSIFAVVAEEMGFVVVVLFISLCILIVVRGLTIARESNDVFGMLLVLGIISWFAVQSLLNIGAIVGLLPLTGVPLPFVSHGGSALMISMAAMGIVVNVSKTAHS